MSTTEPTYRKTKNGTWVAFGPVTAFEQTYVNVRKRNGDLECRRIESLGKSFTVDGVECCYAYLAYSPPDQPRGRGGCGHHEFNGVDMCTRCMYSPM